MSSLYKMELQDLSPNYPHVIGEGLWLRRELINYLSASDAVTNIDHTKLNKLR
jgi:hypothetical protein